MPELEPFRDGLRKVFERNVVYLLPLDSLLIAFIGLLGRSGAKRDQDMLVVCLNLASQVMQSGSVECL